MTPPLKLLRFFLFSAAVLVLAACQSDAERAEAYYTRAMELLEAGDFERARVEFLNVFNHDGFHQAARTELAQMLRAQGRTQQSYSQFLRLVEQYPEDIESRIALAEMAFQFSNWPEVERHAEVALRLAPEDPRVEVIEIATTYATAIQSDDALAEEAAYAQAEARLDQDPDNPLLLRVRLNDQIRSGALEAGLGTLDSLMVREPDARDFHDTRLAFLAELGRAEEIEAQLQQMLALFPEDENLPATLLRFYIASGDITEAESFLRTQAEAADTDQTWQDALGALIQLRMQTGGREAALEELAQIIAAQEAAEDPRPLTPFRAMQASLRFEAGETDTAIAAVEALLAGDTLGLTEAGDLRAVLAQMLLASGNEVGARAQVEQVLEADPGHPEALKLRAAWLIDEDEGDRAIAALRRAIDANPDDVETLTLMAQAYNRIGNRQLAREYLSLAVQASNSAPAPTLRYVEALLAEDRTLSAEEHLLEALRLAPDNAELLARLGELYVTMEDWPRAEQVERSLREQGGEQGLRIAGSLQAMRLAGQGRVEDAVALVEEAAVAAGDGDAQAQIAVVRARLATGDVAGALSYAENLVAGAPDNISYRFTLASLQSAIGDLAGAEASFRALTEDHPDQPQAWLGLIRALNSQGRAEEGAAAVAAGLEALPEALDLLWAQASLYEASGEIDPAIDIYERMYAVAPGAEVVANNLASLLATYRGDDAAALERAWNIARRLRGIEVAPFQDTYGWIAYLRGEYREAQEHLEPAAEGLPEDPLVQYHLAMTYLAVGETAQAVEQFQRAVDLAGPDPRPQFDQARAELERLRNAAEPSDTGASEN